jgi:hypothetical protein
MDGSTTMDAPVELEVDLLLLPFTEAPPDPFVETLSDTLGPVVECAVQDFEAGKGEARVAYPERTQTLRLGFLGLGAPSDLDAGVLRRAGAAGADVARDHEADTVACLMPVDDEPSDLQTAPALVEGFALGRYQYRRYKTADGFEGPSSGCLRPSQPLRCPSTSWGHCPPRTIARATTRTCRGDVAHMHAGPTVEIMNTDAGGRLFLADALSDATDTYDPEVVVDLATRTGSCIRALGRAAAGVMTRMTDAAAERLASFSGPGSGQANVCTRFRCTTRTNNTWKATPPGRRSERPQIRTGPRGARAAACDC